MLPLATSTWDDKEYQALQSVIDSGMFSMGDKVKEFEAKFAAYVGKRHAVMVNSGSSANLLAIAALCHKKEGGLKPGDEVIVPAVSWATTYYPLHQYGLKLKFVDIDLDTLNLDLSQLESAITDSTRAIFSVNLLGNPVDYNRVMEILRGKDVLLLEDNCESLGAVLDGKQLGTFGICGTYSSFFSHHISTMEGGLVVTDDEELFQLMLSLRSHGWTRGLPSENKLCEISNDPFMESFRFILPGYNLRPLEMSGALGIEQLNKLPAIVSGRRQNAEVFVRELSKINGVKIQKETGESSWFGFAIILDGGSGNRSELVSLLSSMGVDCRPIVAGNFVNNEVCKYFDYSVHGCLDNSDFIDSRGFFIGNHHFDVSEEIVQVARVIDNYING